MNDALNPTLNLPSCMVGISDEGDVIPCGDRAPYEVIGWGYGPGREGMRICGDHAWRALDDGAAVTGPQGLPCRLTEDGEIFEEQS